MTKAKAYELFGKWWTEYLWLELNTPEFKKLTYKIQQDKSKGIKICPEKEDIFKAFRLCCINDVKVVILGQDCYHTTLYDGKCVASGLAFGINTVLPSYIPPSLKNIIKELEDDLGKPAIDFDYTLESWAKQGVLLLNTALTVQEGNPNSHSMYWEHFTKAVMEILNTYTDHTVFILWGSNAKSFKQYLDNPTFKFIESSHPSPYSADQSFFGSKPFSKTNNLLKQPINWLEHYE